MLNNFLGFDIYAKFFSEYIQNLESALEVILFFIT